MRISRIVAGLVGLLATLLVFGLAIVALVGWPEVIRWMPYGNVPWMPYGDVPWMPHMGAWWGVPGRGLGVMLVGLTLLALLLAIPLVLIYGFVRTTPAVDDTALQRLRERYANGDIDEEEYERRRRQLEG